MPPRSKARSERLIETSGVGRRISRELSELRRLAERKQPDFCDFPIARSPSLIDSVRTPRTLLDNRHIGSARVDSA